MYVIFTQKLNPFHHGCTWQTHVYLTFKKKAKYQVLCSLILDSRVPQPTPVSHVFGVFFKYILPLSQCIFISWFSATKPIYSFLKLLCLFWDPCSSANCNLPHRKIRLNWSEINDRLNCSKVLLCLLFLFFFPSARKWDQNQDQRIDME